MGILQELCVVAAVVTAQPSWAHGGYPRDCCADHDCRPALLGEIEALQDGRYLVVPTGEIFTRFQARPSFDENFHRCLYNPADPKSRTFCILVPAGS
ncbi:hypothetical protein [Enterovirga sp. CN4-39]|uniref:hypothetical protein n=1 Tax=Enterovirga sp. CN4-39 TaxID=3400910 RepID=UPI003C066C61